MSFPRRSIFKRKKTTVFQLKCEWFWSQGLCLTLEASGLVEDNSTQSCGCFKPESSICYLSLGDGTIEWRHGETITVWTCSKLPAPEQILGVKASLILIHLKKKKEGGLRTMVNCLYRLFQSFFLLLYALNKQITMVWLFQFLFPFNGYKPKPSVSLSWRCFFFFELGHCCLDYKAFPLRLASKHQCTSTLPF